MVPVTYLFVFSLAKEFEQTNSLSRLGTVAPDRRLSSREQHGRVMISMCFFVSGERMLPSLPWMWASRRLASEARLLLSQVVDRVGRIEAPPPLAAAFMYMYRLTGGSISGLLRKRATAANPFTPAFCHSWSSKGNTSTTVWQKKSGAYDTSFNHQRSTKKVSNAKMYVNRRRDEMAWTWKHILRHEHFRAKYQYVGVFFQTPFSTTFRWRIFLKPTGIDYIN